MTDEMLFVYAKRSEMVRLAAIDWFRRSENTATQTLKQFAFDGATTIAKAQLGECKCDKERR